MSPHGWLTKKRWVSFSLWCAGIYLGVYPVMALCYSMGVSEFVDRSFAVGVFGSLASSSWLVVLPPLAKPLYRRASIQVYSRSKADARVILPKPSMLCKDRRGTVLPYTEWPYCADGPCYFLDGQDDFQAGSCSPYKCANKYYRRLAKKTIPIRPPVLFSKKART